MDINRHNLDTVFRNLRADWRNAYETRETDRTEALSIATSIPMSTATLRFDFLADHPEFREWVDQRRMHEYASKEYQIGYKEWELTLRMKLRDIADDNIGLYSVQAQAGGEAAANLMPREVFQGLSDGRTRTCYDGQFFFDTDHPVGVGADATTASNLDSGGGGNYWYLLDTSRTIKPLLWLNREDPSFVMKNNPNDDNVFFDRQILFGGYAAGQSHYGMWQCAFASNQTLNMTNLEAAWNAMIDFRGDRLNDAGTRRKKLGIRPDTLVVTQGLDESRARILAEHSEIPSADDPLQAGDTKVQNRMKGRFRVLAATWLD